MNTETIFDTGADRYDHQKQRVTPRVLGFYQAVIALIPAGRRDTYRLLPLSEKALAKTTERFISSKRKGFFMQDFSCFGSPGEYDRVFSVMPFMTLWIKKEAPLAKGFRCPTLPPRGFLLMRTLSKMTTTSPNSYMG